MPYIGSNYIVPYGAFTNFTPVLPSFYWNVVSAEQRIKEICLELHKLAEYADMLGVNINLDHKVIEQLQADFEKFKESGFEDYYIAIIEQWINDNMERLIKQSIKMVFFGLTDDGYFCAYIPESWSDIQFDTGMVFGTFDYGRLILRYDVDGSGVIDNTGNYGEFSFDELKRRVELLETQVMRNNGTLYTELIQGGE